MRHFARLGCGLFGVLVAVACGGNVSGVSDGAGNGDRPGQSCETVGVKGNRACVPGTAAPNRTITLRVDDSAGCLDCNSAIEGCKVSVDGDRITLSMSAKKCTPERDRICPAVCAIPSAECAIPPLAAGTYSVRVTGEERADWDRRELVVRAGSTETSCSLPIGVMPELEHDKDKYPTSCATDEDCRLATFGHVCAPCKCPNGAVSVTGADAYEADRRALESQCPPRGTVTCAGCERVKATCEIKGDERTGTCKLETVPF